MSYTKGKWVVIDSGGRVMLKAVGEPQIICTLETRPLKITPEVADNARLIAAAPDLLSLLKDMQHEDTEDTTEKGVVLDLYFQRKVASAIEKAE